MKGSFLEKLLSISGNKQSHLCVGIDPDPDKMPSAALSGHSKPERVLEFTQNIIRATSGCAAAFKFNVAFFEALGDEGPRVLREVLAFVPDDVLTIADAKRGDIGNTAQFYARAFFHEMNFDAVTIAPYMGSDSVRPFLEYDGKGVFILVRTSNPGGNDLQTLMVGSKPVYQIVAEQSVSWAEGLPGTVGFVVGATDGHALEALRKDHPTVPFLIPGVGAQGGDARDVMDAAGRGPVLVNSSRQVLYASNRADYASSAREAARQLQEQLNQN